MGNASDRSQRLEGTGYVRKGTGWMTNRPELAAILKGECSNYKRKEQHRHTHLVGGIARQAAVYPPKLVRAVLKVLRDELADRGQLNSHEAACSGPVPEEPSILEDDYWFVDDVNGGILPTEEVKKARSLEMDYLYKQGVYRVVKRSEATAEGIKPIEVRWIDTNKGDPEHPNYRSRLVVREIKARKSPEEQLPANLLFSSTPPLEAMRLLCSLWSTNRFSTHGKKYKLGLWDISTAHFYGRTPKRKIAVELPPEDPKWSEDGEYVGILEKSMYGTQDAPSIWQGHYTGVMEKAGFKRGASNASVFYHPAWDVRVMVHGDDFLALGDKDHLEKVEATLRGAYELKCLGVIGDEEGDKKEVHFLNRLIRCGEREGKSAIFIEADRRHAELLVQNLGLKNGNGVETPDVKKSTDQQMLESRSPALPKDQMSIYRSSVMRAAYLAQDRPDLGHAVKNLARKMVAPTEASLTDLKRLGRYLKKYPDFAQVFPQQARPKCVKVQVDADHAGDAV